MIDASDHASPSTAGSAVAAATAQALEMWRRRSLLRFLLVGALNTAFGYGAFLLALAVMPGALSALALATVVAILFNFVSLGSLVFGSTDPRRLWRFLVTYGTVFAFNAVGLQLLQATGLQPALGGLVLLPGGAALSYVVNRRFVFAAPR